MLSQNLTEFLRYNPDTDMIQIMVDGVWSNWKRAYMTVTALFANGDFGTGYAFGANASLNASYSALGGLSISGESIGVSTPSALSSMRGSYFTPAINLSAYNKLVIELTVNGAPQTVETDLTSYSQMGYFALMTTTGSSASGTASVRWGFATSTSGYFANNRIVEDGVWNLNANVSASVQTIVLE